MLIIPKLFQAYKPLLRSNFVDSNLAVNLSVIEQLIVNTVDCAGAPRQTAKQSEDVVMVSAGDEGQTQYALRKFGGVIYILYQLWFVTIMACQLFILLNSS